MNPALTYEQWLTLPDDERLKMTRSWNAYRREGIGIPLVAGGRFALASQTPILDVRIGTYHGGEYVIHAFVSEDDLPRMPPPLESEFEGFRIIYQK